MSKPGTTGNRSYPCPSDRDTTVLRISSIFAQYYFTLLDPGSGIGVPERAHIKVYKTGFPPFWEEDFTQVASVIVTGEPYFQVDIRPLNRQLLVAVS